MEYKIGARELGPLLADNRSLTADSCLIMTIFKDDITNYLSSLAPAEDELLKSVKAKGLSIGVPSISSTEGKFLYLVSKMVGAKKILELGTAIGYSSIWLERSLADSSKLITVERDEKYATYAKEHFSKLKRDIIDLLIVETTPFLEKLDDQFDIIFMDEYKTFYPIDLKHCIRLLRPGGVLLVHNALEGGWVPKGEIDIESEELKSWHKLVLSNNQLESIILSVGEGFVFAIKK